MMTPKKEAFCIAIVAGDDQTEAYRKAYGAENMKPQTIHKRASELMRDGEVMGRIAELRQPAIEAAQLTLEDHLKTLANLRDKAEKEGKFGPAIQAEIARGKATGLYIERVDLNAKVTQKPEEMSDDDLTAIASTGRR